jgi:UDP-N-acetylmuramyl pentapeptide phosphotransferase/UDP-N-acetylglucosamine-1-phosphate transferase
MYRIFAVYLAVFAASFIGVKLFRRWSLKREIIDVPNERSSHSVPTPRGGGLIIAIVSLLALCGYAFVYGDGSYWAYLAGALIVASISWVDDVRELSPFVRIICHSLAAGLAVWAYGGFDWVWIPFYGIVDVGAAGQLFAFLWLVWLINAYNFMDGIDGIAAMQSITAGIGWLLAGFIFGIDGIAFYGGVLAVSSLGFIILNWQPAKIFMGDVGSAFLGYSFALLPLMASKKISDPTAASIMPWVGVFLVWFFVFDSFYTLLKRLFRGAKIWQPHREHIYQQLVIDGLQHRHVSIIYAAFSLLLVFVLCLALWNSWSLEKTVLAPALVETGLLVVYSRLVTNRQKHSKFFTR